MTPSGIETATFLLVAQCLSTNRATACPLSYVRDPNYKECLICLKLRDMAGREFGTPSLDESISRLLIPVQSWYRYFCVTVSNGF